MFPLSSSLCFEKAALSIPILDLISTPGQKVKGQGHRVKNEKKTFKAIKPERLKVQSSN